MELRVGDRLVDETGDWEVISRPYTTAGGKDARVRVQRVGKPGGTEIPDLARARARSGEARMMIRRAPYFDRLRPRRPCSSPGIRRPASSRASRDRRRFATWEEAEETGRFLRALSASEPRT
jgi:hypothetical protein